MLERLFLEREIMIWRIEMAGRFSDTFGAFFDKLKVNDEYEDEYYDDEEYDDEPVKKSYQKASNEESKKKASYEEEEEEYIPPKKLNKRRSNVVNMRDSRSSGTEVVIVKPVNYEEAREVTDNLKAHKVVVLNLEGLHVELATRISDFTFGSIYALGGKAEVISNEIIVLTPSEIDISGDLGENSEAADSEDYDTL